MARPSPPRQTSCERYGYLEQWDVCPNWFLRYDFAAKPTTSSGEDDDDKSTADLRRHVDKTGSPIVYYTEQTSPTSPNRRRLLSVLSRPRRGLYLFMGFAYVDEQRTTAVIHRSDLVDAFRILVKNWEGIYWTAINLTETYNLGDETLPEPRRCFHSHEYWGRVDALVERLVELQDRMHWAADFYGQYLAWLSDAEHRGRPPARWNRYPGTLTSSNFLLREERHRIRVKKDTIDDYVFRAAARIIGDPSLHPKVAEARDAAVALIEEMLRSIGVEGDRWHQYHPNMRQGTPERRRSVEEERWWLENELQYGVEDPAYAKAKPRPSCCHCGGPVAMSAMLDGHPVDPPYVLINGTTYAPLPRTLMDPPDYTE